MYLTRGFLNPISREVSRDLRDPVALHRTVLRAFPEDMGATPRSTAGVLFRVDVGRDGSALLVVQSDIAPSVGKLPARYFLDPLDDRFFTLGWPTNPLVEALDAATITRGTRLRFRLRGNVTKKIDTKTGDDGKRRNGRRVPLRTDTERIGWLGRKAEAAGFAVLDARVNVDGAESGSRGDAVVTFASVRFEGVLEVRDADRFREALANGIGPGKAYGFGLLSIAPVR